jgi:hypothetical protein
MREEIQPKGTARDSVPGIFLGGECLPAPDNFAATTLRSRIKSPAPKATTCSFVAVINVEYSRQIPISPGGILNVARQFISPIMSSF